MDEKLDNIERQMLKERAERLAKPISLDEDKTEDVSLLVFRSMGSQYAVYLSSVNAVAKIIDIIHIPGTPKHIPGVIRRRGQTTALVNLRFFFFPGTEGYIDEDFAVVVSSKGKTFALQVEDVDGVQPISKDEIIPVPDNFDRSIAPYLKGVTSSGMGLFNLDRMVTADGFGTTRIEE